MSGSNRRRSSSPLAALKIYISQPNIRAVIPTRRALRPGESGYVDGQTVTQSWRQWAGQKIRLGGSGASTMEEVTLFPGWASRRDVSGHEHESECLLLCANVILKGLLFPDAFDLYICVSGYATTRRPPEFLTRSQRAFLRLAKGTLIFNYVEPLGQCHYVRLRLPTQTTKPTVARQRNIFHDRNRGPYTSPSST